MRSFQPVSIRTVDYRRRIMLGGVAAIAMMAASPVIAADADADAAEGQGDIVVTARQRTESAQNVPISLSVVGDAEILKTGTSNFNQIQQLVPSLQITSFNARNTNVTIRGLGANATISVDGLEYGVGFYVDGVYYGRPGQSQVDLIDLQQVEVLNGPQGTLFGKNTTAGAINITTRAPSFEPELIAEANVGNYGYRQFRASGSLPVIADKVALRLTVANTNRDGFLTNVFDGSDAQDYRNLTLRGQLLVVPADNVRVRLIGDYSRQKQHFSLAINDAYFTTLANGARIANNIFDRAARFNYTPLPAGSFARQGAADALFQANMRSYGASGRVDWDLEGASLTSISAYRWWDWEPRNDSDGTPIPVMNVQHTSNRQRQFSQELRIASTGERTIDYVAGLYYYWQVLRGQALQIPGSGYVDWNVNPATTPAATSAINRYSLTGFEGRNTADPSTKSYAAFGQIDWHIAPALTFTGGLRFTHEEKKGSFRQFWARGNDLSLLSPADRAIATAARSFFRELAFSSKLRSDAVSGLATLGYQISPDILTYATYSRGIKSGGLNLTAGGASRPTVAPEKVDNFEIGLKSQFLDRRLTFNAAAYLTNVRDYQANINEQTGPTTSIQYIANIPKVRSKGFEASLSYAPTRLVRLGGALAYTDARYVSYVNAAQAPERTYLGPVQDLSGRSLPLVPKLAWSLNLDASQPIGEELSLYTRIDYLHRSATNGTPTLSNYGRIPAYGVVNARVGLSIADGRYDLSFWARNLGDKDYFISRTVQPIGVVQALPGDPRTYGATIRARI